VTTLEPAPVPGAATPAPVTDTSPPPPTDDRTQARATVRAFRSRRTIPAIITALVLAALAILAAVEVISRLVDQPARVLPVDRLVELGRDNQWDDPLALVVSGSLAAVGLLLLLIAVLPGRSPVVPLAVAAPELVAGITRRALRRDAAAAAHDVAGVTRAAAKLSGRRLRVRVETLLRDPGDLAERVQQAVAARLDLLAPVRPVRVRVAVRRKKGLA
jgi:uncharacterized protein DUF6286